MKFHDDMEMLCKTKGRSNLREDVCLWGAHMYYRTVEMFGNSRWNMKMNNNCKMPWVPMCLPPYVMSPLQASMSHRKREAADDATSPLGLPLPRIKKK